MVIRFPRASLILLLTLPPDKVQGWRIIDIAGQAGGDLLVECKHVSRSLDRRGLEGLEWRNIQITGSYSVILDNEEQRGEQISFRCATISDWLSTNSPTFKWEKVLSINIGKDLHHLKYQTSDISHLYALFIFYRQLSFVKMKKLLQPPTNL